MKITTEYDVGYVFWVPRVRNAYESRVIKHEGEEYSRDVYTLEAYAKNKVVTGIQINIKKDKTVSTTYYCKDIDETNQLLGSYSADDLLFVDYESAIGFARHWRDTVGKEYFGARTVDDE